MVFNYSIGFPQEHPQKWVTFYSRKVTCTKNILRPVQESANSLLSTNVQHML